MTNPQQKTGSQARLYGVQQDLVIKTTRRNKGHHWMVPRYQKTHSETPG